MESQSPFISILIPTYGRHELLVDTLSGLFKQNYSPREIIVYDQSPDHPVEVNEFLENNSDKIVHVREDRKGLVYAYRRCVELSRGDICLFVDDDVIISDPDFVSKHVNNYSCSTIGAASGQVFHEGQMEPRDIDPRVYGKHGWMFVRFDTVHEMENLPSLFGPNMSFRKEAYQQVGGFDLAYGGSGFRFETDFTFAIKNAGYQVVFDPSASLVHRYKQKGGADNRHLLSTDNNSHSWYVDFFANTWYFLRKWYGLPAALKIMYIIWREHVFNRVFMKCGAIFLLRRHKAFISGINMGQKRLAQRNNGI
jgi:glycosyltransferase involved in cell wall biosynthesis